MDDKIRANIALNKSQLAGQIAVQTLPAAVQARMQRMGEFDVIKPDDIVDFVWEAARDMASRIVENQVTTEQVHKKALQEHVEEKRPSGIVIPHPNAGSGGGG